MWVRFSSKGRDSMFVTTGGCVCFWPITAAITEGVLADLACVCLQRGQYCLSTICILYLCIICIHTEVVTVYICVMCLTFCNIHAAVGTGEPFKCHKFMFGSKTTWKDIKICLFIGGLTSSHPFNSEYYLISSLAFIGHRVIKYECCYRSCLVSLQLGNDPLLDREIQAQS